MGLLRRALVFIILLYEIGAVAQHCHRTLGSNIKLEDCQIAVHQLFDSYTRHLSEAQLSQQIPFVRNFPDEPDPMPERGVHGTCYSSVAMARGRQPTMILSWNWLRDTMDHLVKACVMERQLGGTYTADGFGFMVAQIYR